MGVSTRCGRRYEASSRCTCSSSASSRCGAVFGVLRGVVRRWRLCLFVLFHVLASPLFVWWFSAGVFGQPEAINVGSSVVGFVFGVLGDMYRQRSNVGAFVLQVFF